MELKKMSVNEWIDVLDNPIQRNTEVHAKKALRNHLKSSSPIQAKVSAAELPDGTLIKLDGHTRSLLWETGRLERPDVVYCDVYHVQNLEMAKLLYSHFDNPIAAENAIDRLSGALRDANIVLKSPYLMNGLSSALRVLEGGKSAGHIYGSVLLWKREIEMLDSLCLKSQGANSGRILGCLALLRKRNLKAINFILAVDADGGTKSEMGRDGVESAVQSLRDCKGMNGEAGITEVAERLISCGEMYLANRFSNRLPRGTSLHKYLGR